MATFTAQILIGRSHPNDGGMAGELKNSPVLLLSENSRPGWVLRPGHWFLDQRDSGFKAASEYVLIPSLESTLEDGIALLALVLCHDLPWSDSTRTLQAQLMERKRLEIHDLDEQIRSVLKDEVRARSASFPKIVLSIFQPDCLIHGQISDLQHYANQMAVCMPVFTRNLTQWSSEPNETGSLDSPSAVS